MATRRSIAREARDQRVYLSAARGMTYREIAATEGLSRSRVGQIVKAQAAEQSQENKDHARDFAMKRATTVIRVHMSTIKDPKSAKLVLDANEQLARLLGLYTPQQGAGTAEAASLLDQLVAGLDEPQ